jgi:flavin reductase (DIM6/NTAB) family NADH-FMN oxidoreductase RutF
VGRPASVADQDAYRSLSAVGAHGVAIITAVLGGWDVAVPLTDYLSVSYDPPTMLVSLYGLSRIAEAVEASGSWCLSVLAASQSDLVARFSMPGAPLDGLLAQTPHHRPIAGGPVVIDGAVTWFQLRTVQEHDAATHCLFVGEVTAMGTASPLDAWPLVRSRGTFLR